MQRVSSAYCKWEITKLLPPKSKPLNKFAATAFLIKPLKPSATNKNKKGASGSPCLSPLWMLISSVGLPFTSTDILPPHTRLYPCHALLTHPYSLHHIFQETPIHRIICLLKIHLENLTFLFSLLSIINQFIHHQHSIHQIPPL